MPDLTDPNSAAWLWISVAFVVVTLFAASRITRARDLADEHEAERAWHDELDPYAAALALANEDRPTASDEHHARILAALAEGVTGSRHCVIERVGNGWRAVPANDLDALTTTGDLPDDMRMEK